MSKPAIEIKGLSKAYMIGHEREAMVGTMTFRDSIVNIARKPVELITGHQMKKEKFWALKDVNLEINQGDVVGIIGRNGSGKSTLLKVLSRIVEPTKGEVIMRGRVASLLEVGTGFHPELTGRENVYFNGAILGMTRKEIQSKFDEIVAFSEVEKFLDTPVKFYSSGMYVRLAFAVAAHLDPDILIVDEVLAVGDAAFQKKCLGKMKDVAGQGRTVLFVSHSMPAVKSLCSQCAWMQQGRVLEFGDIDKVADSYLRSSLDDDVDVSKKPRTPSVTGEASITGVKIKTVGSSSTVIDSTKPLSIELEIDSKETLKNEINVHCGIMMGGQPIFTLSTEYTGKHYVLSEGKNYLTCVIDPCNLTGGTYTINCSLLYSGPHGGSHIDEVYDAISFTVEDLQSPSKEQFISQSDAIYFVNHSWSQK